MCNNRFTGKNGLLSSPNYPIYENLTDCTSDIIVNSNSSIRVYLVDVDLEKEYNSI